MWLQYRKRSGSGAQKYSVLYANLLLHAVVVVDDDKVAAPVLVRTKILDKRLKLILHELSELSGILFFRLLFLDGLWWPDLKWYYACMFALLLWPDLRRLLRSWNHNAIWFPPIHFLKKTKIRKAESHLLPSLVMIVRFEVLSQQTFCNAHKPCRTFAQCVFKRGNDS